MRHQNLPGKPNIETLLEEFIDLIEMHDIALKTHAPASVMEQLQARMMTIKKEMINSGGDTKD